MPLRLARLPLLLLAAAPALGAPAAPSEAPAVHAIRLRLDPASSEIRGSERLMTAFASKQRFSLREGLEIEGITCGEQDLLPRLRPDRKASAPGHWELRVPRSCSSDDGHLALELSWRGAIDGRETAPADGGAPVLLIGDAVHPLFDEPARRELIVDVPRDWSVAAPGAEARPTEAPEPQRALFAFESDAPGGGIGLAAGSFAVTQRQRGPLRLRHFRSSADEAHAARLLDACERALHRLEAVLGPYPHPRLDLVETSDGGGADLPGLAWLGPDAQAAREGALDEALVRSWWASPPARPTDGNSWREILTSFLAHEPAADERGPDAALSYRRRLALRGGHGDGDGATASRAPWQEPFLHALRRELGDEAFWSGVSELLRAPASDEGGWATLREHFERAAGRDLGPLFQPWISGDASFPALALSDVALAGGQASGVVTGGSGNLHLAPELRVRMRDGEELSSRIDLKGSSTAFAIPAPGEVASIELDPDWHFPRVVLPADAPQSLARTLAAPALGHDLLIAHPIAPYGATAALQARADAYKALADELARLHGGESLPALAVADAEWNASSIVLLGGPEENPLVKRVQDGFLAAGFDLTGIGFRAGTRRWSRDGDSLLATIPHPDRAGASVSAWMPLADEAMEVAPRLLDFASEGWVVLRDGEAVEQGTEWPANNPWRVQFAAPAPPAGVAQRLRAEVERLERPELEGRDAATTASRRTGEELAAALSDAGLQPWDPRGYQHVFFWYLRDLPRQAKLFRQRPDRSADAWDCTPAAYWLPVPQDLMSVGGSVELADEAILEPILVPFPEGLVHAGTLERPAFSGLDLRGAAAVILDDAPLPPRESPEARAAFERDRGAAYMELLNEVRRHEGETLIVVRPRDEPPFFPSFATYRSLDGERDPELAAATRDGGTRAPARAVSARIAAAPPPPVPVRLAFAGAELLEAMKAEEPLRAGRRWWQGLYLDLRMRIETRRLFDRNLIGMTAGQLRLSEGLVLVSAHHDGPGLDAEGRVRPGALDNAAGTAVMLELARRLGADPPPLTVAFVSFGASEWGLIGSRSLAESWPGHWPVRALVNIDSVGAPGAGLRVLGAEAEPALAETILSAARAQGLQAAPSTAGSGARASEESADHSPWSSRGIPAVTLTGAEAADVAPGSEDLDYEDLERIVDALEAAIRQLAAGAAS